MVIYRIKIFLTDHCFASGYLLYQKVEQQVRMHVWDVKRSELGNRTTFNLLSLPLVESSGTNSLMRDSFGLVGPGLGFSWWSQVRPLADCAARVQSLLH